MKQKSWIVLAVVVIILGLFYLNSGEKIVADPKNLPDAFLGPENASIVVIEYSDFQCPYCGAAMGDNVKIMSKLKSQNPLWEPSVPRLKQLAEEGKIKFVFKHFPVSGHGFSQKASEAAESASSQGKFWEMHDLLFQNQDNLKKSDLYKYAKQIGLDMDQFKYDLEGGAFEASVKKDLLDGNRAGVTGTPTFFINGQKVVGAQSFSVFEEIINSLENKN